MGTLTKTSKTLTPLTLTALRVGAGSIMIVHGWMKATDFGSWRDSVASMGVPLPDLMAPLAIAGELGGGIGLVLGLLTPLAALGVVSVMSFAIAFVHYGNGLLAKDGGWEYPLTLLLVSLFFVTRGAGPISLDHLIFGRTREAKERGRERGGPRTRVEAHA